MHLEADASEAVIDEVHYDLYFTAGWECKGSVINVEHAEYLEESSVGE